MSHFPAYICENGHAISYRFHSCPDKFCKSCGGRIISKCPSCGFTIAGVRNNEYSDYLGFIVPAYCPDCGKPYPWTSAAIQATIDLLAEDDDIPEKDRRNLAEVLPDVIVETPRTQLASVRIRKAIANAGAIAGEALRQFVIDFGCELIKKRMGLS